MPHCQIEYTANLREAGDIPGLLRKIAAKYENSGGVFPVFGIRVRAIELADYVVNEGDPTNAFVHATCVIATGRTEEFRRAFFGEMFEIIKAHLAPAAEGRFLGVSLDVVTGTDMGSYKFNF